MMEQSLYLGRIDPFSSKTVWGTMVTERKNKKQIKGEPLCQELTQKEYFTCLFITADTLNFRSIPQQTACRLTNAFIKWLQSATLRVCKKYRSTSNQNHGLQRSLNHFFFSFSNWEGAQWCF